MNDYKFRCSWGKGLLNTHCGKRFVILTTVPHCKGLAIEPAIQLQQMVSRKQQTKLKHCVQQSWEHYQDTKTRLQEQVNTANKTACQSSLAQLPSLSYHPHLHTSCICKTPPRQSSLVHRMNDANKHVFNFSLLSHPPESELTHCTVFITFKPNIHFLICPPSLLENEAFWLLFCTCASAQERSDKHSLLLLMEPYLKP